MSRTWRYDDPRIDREVDTLYALAQRGVLPSTAPREEALVARTHQAASWRIGEQVGATRRFTLQVLDAAGAPAQRCMVTVWLSDTEYGAPASGGSYVVETGVELQPRAGYLSGVFCTDATGRVVLAIDQTTATKYVQVSSGPFVSSSGAVTWT